MFVHTRAENYYYAPIWSVLFLKHYDRFRISLIIFIYRSNIPVYLPPLNLNEKWAVFFSVHLRLINIDAMIKIQETLD